MRRRTVEQMEQYAAGYNAAVATTNRLINEGYSLEDIPRLLEAHRIGVQSAVETEREFNAR